MPRRGEWKRGYDQAMREVNEVLISELAGVVRAPKEGIVAIQERVRQLHEQRSGLLYALQEAFKRIGGEP